MLQDPGQKQQFEKNFCQTQMLILESLSERQEETVTQPGNKDTMAATLESPFYHGAGKHHFGILPLAY